MKYCSDVSYQTNSVLKNQMFLYVAKNNKWKILEVCYKPIK